MHSLESRKQQGSSDQPPGALTQQALDATNSYPAPFADHPARALTLQSAIEESVTHPGRVPVPAVCLGCPLDWWGCLLGRTVCPHCCAHDPVRCLLHAALLCGWKGRCGRALRTWHNGDARETSEQSGQEAREAVWGTLETRVERENGYNDDETTGSTTRAGRKPAAQQGMHD